MVSNTRIGLNKHRGRKNAHLFIVVKNKQVLLGIFSLFYENLRVGRIFRLKTTNGYTRLLENKVRVFYSSKDYSKLLKVGTKICVYVIVELRWTNTVNQKICED